MQSLWRFPVVGIAGEQLRSTQIDARGLAGDRQHFAAGPEGRLTVHDLPGLADWQATFPFNPDGAIHTYKDPPFPVLVRLDYFHRSRLFRSGNPTKSFIH